MNVIKTKIISLKLSKTSSKERLDVPSEGLGKVSYIRRFSVPYGQAVESWKKEELPTVFFGKFQVGKRTHGASMYVESFS